MEFIATSVVISLLNSFEIVTKSLNRDSHKSLNIQTKPMEVELRKSRVTRDVFQIFCSQLFLRLGKELGEWSFARTQRMEKRVFR